MARRTRKLRALVLIDYGLDIIKYCNALLLNHSMTMSQVVKSNRGYLQLLACCPHHQRQFLLKTATPQQMHAIVQAIHNVLHSHVPVTEQVRLKLIPNKDSIVDLVNPKVPYKYKKQILVQEGSGFIQDVLTPVITSLGFLML